MSVIFKSIPIMFNKEKNGLKPNTIREIDEFDDRFRKLAEFETNLITIKNSETGETFTRKITDISIWKNIMIISWKHEEVSNE